MRLLLAEKPSMGRAIASALGLSGTGRTYIQGQDLIVTWCIGHLVEAVGPEVYDPALKTWRWDHLPIFPETFRYEPIAATREHCEAVARLLNRTDVTEVINATDAGREGELIFDLVYRLSGCTKPVLRFWTSSLTDEAIREAFANLKPGEAYVGLRDAARSRQEADWLVGINGTRAQTLAARRSGSEGVHSIGRVQTPTLAILVHREREIRSFVPKDFWTLQAIFRTPEGTYRGKWFRTVDGKDHDRFETETEARELAARLAGHPGQVRSVTGKTEKKKPELLYDLTTLQKEANKRFGFTAEHTLAVAQDLYEAKLLSYPRTNSRHLTKADEAKAAGWLKALAQGQLLELKPFLEDLRQRWPVSLDKRFVDDSQVEDHSALVITETPAQGLSGDRLKIYELVARRFLAAYFPERIEVKTTVITVVNDATFKTLGTVVKDPGWSAVDPPPSRPSKAKSPKEADPEDPSAEDREEESGILPPLSRKQAVDVEGLTPKAGKTSPPKRMTEADLLAAMQGAGRELDDEALKGALKDRGLGTPATRANIIETLLKRGYVVRKRNILQPTDKGIALIEGLNVESLTSPHMTGLWEARLERMRRGEEPREAFMEDVKRFVEDLVRQIRATSPSGPRPLGGPVVGKCPRCGGPLHRRQWEGRTYVRCGTEDCRVAYDTDAEGQPLERCACGGPRRTFRDGHKVCLACGARDDEPAAPAPRPCPRCGNPMRVIPSTRRGRWFQRCRACDVTEAG